MSGTNSFEMIYKLKKGGGRGGQSDVMLEGLSLAVADFEDNRRWP